MTESKPLSPAAEREKRIVALSSVGVAVALTGGKLVVGLMTGSLGILSEAAHSGLDLVAAVVTLLAVRVSSRPADSAHSYGHGKIENLSALFETLLLLGTCVWIIYEAVERLFFKDVVVEVSWWAFGVVLVSIVLDYSRSRALLRVARKYQSQALEADALHFSTDIWSSAVVLVGLGLMLLADHTGSAWLKKADTVAALGVAAIVVWVSYRLGRKTIADLLDEVPPRLLEDVRHAVRVAGVVEVTRARVRRAGPESFVDVTLSVAPGTSLVQGHEIADEAEAAVQRLLPAADVVVHVEPAREQDGGEESSLPAAVHALARRLAGGAHDVRVHSVLGELGLEAHLEVSPALTVAEAHARATEFESALRQAFPALQRIVTHLEPALAEVEARPAPLPEVKDVEAVLEEVIREQGSGHCHPHEVSVSRVGGELHVTLHCTLAADVSIVQAHAFTERVERLLVARLPAIGQVVIHVEPPEPSE
jgi:cation diffusion facilitator family transporter